MRAKNGFTLVELIAVITIVALLLILLIPNITNVSENSKVSLRSSKIRTIVTAGEEFGNADINAYQNCLGSMTSTELSETCTITVPRLVRSGLLEGEDDDDNIIDPVTNRALEGKVLLCYNPSEVNVYAYYVDDENYSCKDISLNSDNTLNLSTIGGTGYVGGKEVQANIIKGGEFESFSCTSDKPLYATCSIIDDAKISMSVTNDHDITFENEYEEVTMTLTGTFTDNSGTKASLTKKYTLRVYPTGISLVDGEDHCIHTGSTSQINIESLNAGTISVTSSDKDALEGSAKDGRLYMSAKNKTGKVTLTAEENNGYNSTSIERTVYALEVGEIPETLLVNKTEEIKIRHGGTGNITITSSDPNVVMVSKADTIASRSIILPDETAFNIHAVGVGIATITIEGEECGKIEKKIAITNMSLSNTKGFVYIGGKAFTAEIDVKDTTGLTCQSSNTDAATCEIHATTLEVYPGNTPADSVIITVTSANGGFASVDIQVLKTEVRIVNRQGQVLDNVCTQKDSRMNSDEIFVRGQNIGALEVYEIVDWYLADAYFVGTTDELHVESRNVIPGGADAPYVTGYNTGRTRIDIKEGNGNQIGSFFYDIYTLELGASQASIEVDESTTFEVLASGTGEITVESSDTEVATVSIASHTAYDDTVNSQNVRLVTVTGNSTGSATITIRGARCGVKTFNVGVEGKTFSIKLEPGTYTTRLGSDQISCTTTGKERSCKATFPDIYTTDEFDIVGYSRTKDALSYSYQAGDTITIDRSNNGSTYYGNSTDSTKPVCSIPQYNTNTIIGEISYFTLNCIDTGSGINGSGALSVSNFNSINPTIGEVVEVSNPTTIANGYSYRVGIQSKKTGLYNISLNANSLTDKFGNGNNMITLQNIFASEHEAIETWYVGKANRSDVFALLYDNATLTGGTGYTLAMYGTGEMLDFMSSSYNYYAPWYENYRTQITNLIINDGITNLGSGSLYNVTSLTSATISDDVRYIGANAFANTNLTSINIPVSTTSIGDQAFYGNLNLSSITLNNNLTSIGYAAFYNHRCESITIPASVTTIGDYAFGVEPERSVLTSLTFASNSTLTSIGAGAFIYHKLSTLTIPASVETIGEMAFYQETPSTLSSLNFASSANLTEIQDRAFANASLSSLSLPNSLEIIGSEVFGSLQESVTSITIGSNVRSIGENFAYGDGLREFVVDDGNGYYTSQNGILYNKTMTTLVKCPDDYYNVSTTLNVPSTVTTIQSGAFTGHLDVAQNMSGLTINLPSGITAMNIDENFISQTISAINISGNSSFVSENGVLFNKDKTTIYRLPPAMTLSTYTIPDTVTTIADDFTYGNMKTSTITIPSSVTTIGSRAFLTDPTYAVGTINLNASDTVSFDETSFSLLAFDESTSLASLSRTINVRSESLKSNIESLYSAAPYNLNVVNIG